MILIGIKVFCLSFKTIFSRLNERKWGTAILWMMKNILSKYDSMCYTIIHPKENSLQACLRRCYQNYIADRCGCGDPRNGKNPKLRMCGIDDSKFIFTKLRYAYYVCLNKIKFSTFWTYWAFHSVSDPRFWNFLSSKFLVSLQLNIFRTVRWLFHRMQQYIFAKCLQMFTEMRVSLRIF